MRDTSKFIEELGDIIGPAHVVHNRDELIVYENDGFPIAKGLPTAVVFPRNTEEVAACVRCAAAHDMPLIPRGSGTGLAGGAVAYGEGLIVVTTRMTDIKQIDVDNRFAVVQAGVRNLALTDALAGTGLRFSPDPSSQRAATIGGNAATNAGGINTLKHGVTTNHILGVEFVTPDGRIHLTRANGLQDGIGADLPALLCGSEGTLGIITRLWCRLSPIPKSCRTIYAVYPSVRDACNTVRDVTAAGIIPTSMELMDAGIIRVVEDAFSFGFPDSAKALLLIEIDGLEFAIDDELDQVVAICDRNNSSQIEHCSDSKRRAELWSARKRAFGALGRLARSYCTQDACVPRSKLPDVLERVIEIGREHGLTIHNLFHAGDGNIHPIMLFDEDDPEQVQRTLRCSEAILKHCISVGGTITGEHGVGVEKLHLMPHLFNRPTLNTFDRIKTAFDPDRRANDAKLIPSDRLEIELLKPIAPNVPGGAG